MPNLRDRSKIFCQKKFQGYNTNCFAHKKWSFEDKKRLLLFIKRYGIDRILSNPYLFFSNKSVEEIESFIKNIKNKKFPNNYTEYYVAMKDKGPFEIWAEIFDDLYANSKKHSSMMAQAINKIINCEKMDESNSPEDPKWQLIYQYLSCALSRQPLPQLSGIDAAVILKLIDDLISHLDTFHLESQNGLLMKKFTLLNQSKSEEDIFNKMEILNKALLLGNPNEGKWELSNKRSNLENLVLDVQKEPLYFLNPLNLPIKLLKPQIKQNSSK